MKWREKWQTSDSNSFFCRKCVASITASCLFAHFDVVGFAFNSTRLWPLKKIKLFERLCRYVFTVEYGGEDDDEEVE